MKIIKNKRLTGSTLHYPVGRYVTEWMIITKEYAKIIKSLVTKNDDIGLVVQGSSGAIIAALTVSHLKGYNVEIKHLKKDGESSHSSKVPRISSLEKLFILDDFICTGETIERIVEKVKSFEVEAIIVCECDGIPTEYPNVKRFYWNHF
jgi:orotate phosphoribosyltransferase-like protein